MEIEEENYRIGQKYDEDKFAILNKENDIAVCTNNNNNDKDSCKNKNKKAEEQTIIDWDNLDSNKVNEDRETIKIQRFQVELKNFADDCALEMCPILNKCNLTKKIKYGYRLNLQHGMNQFYNWTLYDQFILAQVKCNTVTFSRKQQQFHAYVYKLGENKLELIHSNKNCSQKCKHNERQNYINPMETKEEDNGDSDLINFMTTFTLGRFQSYLF